MEKQIVWTPEMSVGVEEIDNQHKQFIKLIADFHLAIGENKLEEELERIFKSLEDYTGFHFQTEENYFEKFNYEFKDEHIEKHKGFIEKVSVFEERFKKEGVETNVALDSADFLLDWLVEHIEDEDQKYVKCFHDNGLF